jgi:copper homeostasis protein
MPEINCSIQKAGSDYMHDPDRKPERKLEICCFDLSSAVIAQESGAHRVELCASPAEGGTTPALGTIRMARELLHIELYPIIRPRGGDFLFSDDEFRVMQQDVALCREAGCDGVVIGALRADGTIDKDRVARLVERAYPLGVTFHRAFDWAADPFHALEELIAIGCERILSSGQRPLAIDGAELLHELVDLADGRIIIMPGSGLRAANMAGLAQRTGATEFHSSARTRQASTMKYANVAMAEDQSTVIADREEIKGMLAALGGA